MNRIIALVVLAIGMVIAYFTADINPAKEYGWFLGWWHGVHFVSNWILSLFMEGRLLKAVNHTTWYNIWWWISTVGFTASTVWRLVFPPKAK